MSQTVIQYEIYLPLQYNDRTWIEEEKYNYVHQRLFDRFGGVTHIMQDFPLRGSWREHGEVYHDYVIIYTVIDFNLEADNSRFFRELKEELKGLFRQKEILITGVEVTVF